MIINGRRIPEATVNPRVLAFIDSKRAGCTDAARARGAINAPPIVRSNERTFERIPALRRTLLGCVFGQSGTRGYARPLRVSRWHSDPVTLIHTQSPGTLSHKYKWPTYARARAGYVRAAT